MIQRFLLLQPVICALLLDQDWQKKLDVNLSNNDWNLMEKVVKILEVFYEATVRFSSSSACISEVIPTVTGLSVTLSVVDQDDNGVKDFKRKLKASLLLRLGEKELLERYSIATLHGAVDLENGQLRGCSENDSIKAHKPSKMSRLKVTKPEKMSRLKASQQKCPTIK